MNEYQRERVRMNARFDYLVGGAIDLWMWFVIACAAIFGIGLLLTAADAISGEDDGGGYTVTVEKNEKDCRQAYLPEFCRIGDWDRNGVREPSVDDKLDPFARYR